MWTIKPPLRDTQQEFPIAYCPVCGGEIYEMDEVVMRPSGEMLHQECDTEDEEGKPVECIS